MSMTFPTIHPNGTGKQALLDAIYNAGVALDDAIMAVHWTAPNQRDYGGPSAENFQLAEAQHIRRIVTLDAVKSEFFGLYEAIKNQPE